MVNQLDFKTPMSSLWLSHPFSYLKLLGTEAHTGNCLMIFLGRPDRVRPVATHLHMSATADIRSMSSEAP